MAEKARKRVSIIEVKKREIDEEKGSCEEKSLNISTGPKFACRHVQSILLCLALIVGIGTRTNLSVAIVAMTENGTSSNPEVPTYIWNNTSIILSAFFWSYITFQVLAGYLGKTYGPKYFLLVALCINFTVCALIPIAAAKWGSIGVIICRVMQGLSQGFLYPSIHVMMGTWVPEEERTTLNNLVFSGITLGTMFSSILTGYVSASWYGWPFSFYILAILGFMWCILWAFFGQNTPASHPTITSEERKYIQNSLKQDEPIHIPTPWKQIFTCVPFYALIVAYIGNAWGYSILMTETPTYLSKVMNYDVKANAVFCSIPTALGLLTGFVTGPLSDWIIGRNYLNTLNTRRLFHIVGSYGQALCLIWLSFLTEAEASTSIVVLSIANALTSFVLVGGSVNHLDLSPRFSGVIYGIVNAIGQAISILAPLSAQWILTDMKDITQWRIVFMITVGFFVAGSTIFAIFASATRQSWDGPEDKTMAQRRKKISVISFSGM